MTTQARLSLLFILGTFLGLVHLATGPLRAQEAKPTSIATFSTVEDHQNMLRQLGIKKLRPGPSGNDAAPNRANYDEALANPYPTLPELLVCRDGTVVKTKEEWINKRRPEIVALFEKEVIGRIPADVPPVTWKIIEEKEISAGDIPVIEKTLEGIVDNSRCPAIEVKITLRVGVPKGAGKPVPMLMMFGGRVGPPAAAFRASGPVSRTDSGESRLGLCLPESDQHPARQRRRTDSRNHRAHESWPTP